MGLINEATTNGVLMEVMVERERQDEKWGEQNHVNMVDPDTVGGRYVRQMFAGYADRYKEINDAAAKAGTLDWVGIFLEEVYEALAERNPAKLRTELVQAVAVGVAWIEKIDRDTAKAEALWDGQGQA